MNLKGDAWVVPTRRITGVVPSVPEWLSPFSFLLSPFSGAECARG